MTLVGCSLFSFVPLAEKHRKDLRFWRLPVPVLCQLIYARILRLVKAVIHTEASIT